MSAMLLWGFGLVLLAGFLLFIELFVPSGGVIGLVAGVTAISGVVFFWRESTMWGLSATLGVLILGPCAVAFMLKIYPETYVGRKLILGGSRADEDSFAARIQAQAEEQAIRGSLIGRTGVTINNLRPVGEVRIDGHRHEALAESGVIDAGVEITVVSVVDNQIKVRPTRG
jgi:membrane-bound ClpP family serine protease